MDNLNNLECSLLGILGSIANGVLGGVAAGTELTLHSKWLPIKLVLFWRCLIYFDFAYT